MQHGDFTALAEKYALYRPGYSPFICKVFAALAEQKTHHKVDELLCADIGAGTGIWSRQLARQGLRVTAVEPNAAMRAQGEKKSPELAWEDGSAEKTGLPAQSCDLVTMASSFHWTDFSAAIKEFDRILKPGGFFMALWNTRFIESSQLLLRIENHLHELVPELKRVSSGRSEFCENLTDRLHQQNMFADVLYLEGKHTEQQNRERYIGLWESVNDIRVQAGEKRFAQFLDYIQEEIKDIPVINAEYLTRAWIAQKK